ncbi:MAG: AarF/ABC1/UbiB kinase family protein [Christensenellaceae bacterium]|nr:AarF/ABC1/UbiB kinase family protein [Christensenellaceae bacterium]
MAKSASEKGRFRDILKVLARHEITRGLSPEKLRRVLEDLGPTFVKFGQLLSMRPDILPDEYCEALTQLRTDVMPMDFETVRGVLEAEYGKAPEQVFASIDSEPAGSASIAQAHRAVLKDGRPVILKVQRPGIYEKMAQDMRLLHRASSIFRIVRRSGQVIDFDNVIDEMWSAAQQEMDFLIEAGHIREFTENNAGIPYIAFPKVETALTTPRVLVMEYVDGIQIDDTEALKKAGYNPADLCDKLAANYLKQVVDDGFFHADPHPGNIRVRDGKIVWIALGMTGRLSARHRHLFKSAVIAAAENDYYALKSVLLSLATATGPVDHIKLYADIEEMMTRYAAEELGNIDIGVFVMVFLHVAEENGLVMPTGVSMLARGILTIEGVRSRVSPKTNLMNILAVHVSDTVLHEKSVKEGLLRGGRALYAFGKRTLDLPGQASDLLRMAAKGQARIGVELVGSEAPLARFDRIMNRLIVGIVNAAAVIGSSILCTTDMDPKLLGIPLLGVLGFTASFITTVWLIVRILRANRKPGLARPLRIKRFKLKQ